MADQNANAQAFGYSGTGQGRMGYPQIRFTALVENGTHVLFGVACSGFKNSEVSLAHQTITHLKPGMLCTADYGLVIAQYAIRKLMQEASLGQKTIRQKIKAFPSKKKAGSL